MLLHQKCPYFFELIKWFRKIPNPPISRKGSLLDFFVFSCFWYPRYQRIIGHMLNVLKIFCLQLRLYGPVGHVVSFQFLHPESRPQCTKVDSWKDPYFFSFFDKMWEKPWQLDLCEFYMNVCEFFTKFCGIFINSIEKKREKLKIDWFLPHFLSKKKKYGSFQESTLAHCRCDSGCKNWKLTTWP